MLDLTNLTALTGIVGRPGGTSAPESIYDASVGLGLFDVVQLGPGAAGPFSDIVQSWQNLLGFDFELDHILVRMDNNFGIAPMGLVRARVWSVVGGVPENAPLAVIATSEDVDLDLLTPGDPGSNTVRFDFIGANRITIADGQALATGVFEHTTAFRCNVHQDLTAGSGQCFTLDRTPIWTAVGRDMLHTVMGIRL